MYIDNYAVIVQKDLDGGDTLQREGMVAFGKGLLYDPKNNIVFVSEFKGRSTNSSEIISRFEVRPGIYIRHPDPSKWYSNPDATSRDQVFPIIAYCAVSEDYSRLWRLFLATAKRGMFAQNFLRIGDGETDRKIPDPMHLNVAQFIRAGGWWTAPLYPLLFIYDTIETAGTLITALPLHLKDDHLIPRARMTDDVDDNNVVIQHLLAAKYKPTPISWFNRYLYSVTRSRNLGNIVMGEKNPVMGALAWYHRAEYNGRGNPEIAELYRPLIEEYFTFKTPSETIADLWDKLFPKKTYYVQD